MEENVTHSKTWTLVLRLYNVDSMARLAKPTKFLSNDENKFAGNPE